MGRPRVLLRLEANHRSRNSNKTISMNVNTLCHLKVAFQFVHFFLPASRIVFFVHVDHPFRFGWQWSSNWKALHVERFKSELRI